eukprot:3935828-Rhodomonas_salina.4
MPLQHDAGLVMTGRGQGASEGLRTTRRRTAPVRCESTPGGRTSLQSAGKSEQLSLARKREDEGRCVRLEGAGRRRSGSAPAEHPLAPKGPSLRFNAGCSGLMYGRGLPTQDPRCSRC